MYSYIRIFSDMNIRSYHICIICLIRIYSDIHSYCFLIRIYSDIRSYRFLDINIFEYSFVSKIYIRHTLVCWQLFWNFVTATLIHMFICLAHTSSKHTEVFNASTVLCCDSNLTSKSQHVSAKHIRMSRRGK